MAKYRAPLLNNDIIRIEENKKRTLFSSHTYHLYKGKKVIGYICSDEPPQ